jgi:hypothetical protein
MHMLAIVPLLQLYELGPGVSARVLARREPAMTIAFVEKDCEVGGSHCPMWEAWLMACDDADPKAIEQERDPAELPDFTFDPDKCACPETCRLSARSRP